LLTASLRRTEQEFIAILKGNGFKLRFVPMPGYRFNKEKMFFVKKNNE